MIACWYAPNHVPEKATNANHLTLIIPFRNEADHLPKLLGVLSLQLRNIQGTSILLVDDHSTDESAKLAAFFAEQHPNVVVLNQEQTHGKKQGVELAVQHTSTEWIITLDADTTPCEGWLERIAAWTLHSAAEMLILPLHIGPGNNTLGKLQEVEFASVMGITAGMAMVGNPILCNGGNLCFRKSAYQRTRATRTDMHITSGDDLFLLHALKPSGKVAWVHDPHTRVSSAPHTTWMGFSTQRLRWMGKTGAIKDSWLQGLAQLTFLANASLLLMAIAVAAGAKTFYIPLIILAGKVVLDAWLIVRVGKWMCIKRLKRFYFLLIFLYPFYATLFPLMSQFIRPSWKGRKTITQ